MDIADALILSSLVSAHDVFAISCTCDLVGQDGRPVIGLVTGVFMTGCVRLSTLCEKVGIRGPERNAMERDTGEIQAVDVLGIDVFRKSPLLFGRRQRFSL